jgi:hypothetical protein
MPDKFQRVHDAVIARMAFECMAFCCSDPETFAKFREWAIRANAEYGDHIMASAIRAHLDREAVWEQRIYFHKMMGRLGVWNDSKD